MKINRGQSSIKKAFMAGLLVGLVFAVYSNLTDCHPQILGAGAEACDNKIEVWLGLFEFLLYFPAATFLNFLGLSYLLSSDYGFQVLIILSPIVFFSFLGLIVGLVFRLFEKIGSGKEEEEEEEEE